MLHRLHEESTTSHLINEHKRGGEDLEMFLKFWPSGIAHWINKFYAREKSIMDRKPMATIIIPVYNAQAYLEKCFGQCLTADL